MFKHLKKWLGGSAAAVAAAAARVRRAAVYASDGAIFVFAQGELAASGLTTTTALSGQLPAADAPPEPLGRIVLDALNAYRTNLPEGGSGDANAVPRAVGFNGWTALERGARHVSVEMTGDTVSVTPWKPHAEGGLVPAADAPLTCPPEPRAIGERVAEALRAAPPPPGVKPPRKPPRRDPTGGDADLPPAGTLTPFGYKTAWLAVPTTDARGVADVLGLFDVRPAASWEDGMREARESVTAVFVTPSVAGWTLAVGDVPEPREPMFVDTLERLSARFGEAQYFATHRVVEYHAWARASDGRVARAYAYVGDRGEVLLDRGRRTAEEEALGLTFSAAEIEAAGELPDEQHVLRIAGEWSLNPLEIDALESRGHGLVGRRRRKG